MSRSVQTHWLTGACSVCVRRVMRWLATPPCRRHPYCCGCCCCCARWKMVPHAASRSTGTPPTPCEYGTGRCCLSLMSVYGVKPTGLWLSDCSALCEVSVSLSVRNGLTLISVWDSNSRFSGWELSDGLICFFFILVWFNFPPRKKWKCLIMIEVLSVPCEACSGAVVACRAFAPPTRVRTPGRNYE